MDDPVMDGAAPGGPVPGDTKDWTWVLERPCPECGFDARSIGVPDIADLVLANAAGWQDVLTRPDVAERSRPGVWSPLEYACHVRDVFVLFDHRLGLLLDEDDPQFANWDQDETAVAERYHEQDPGTVAVDLQAAAETVAASFAAVTPGQWDRRGRRSDGAVFTVETFGRYFIHDPMHHLVDVT